MHTIRDNSGKQCNPGRIAKSLLVGSAPKPLPASASAVVIFTKRESRHASIACKTQESDMTVSFRSAHWRKRIWRRKILQPQNIVLVFRGLGAEPSTSFLQFGPDCIACSYANVVHLPCLQLCKCSTFALLATMSYAKPQFETFSKEKKNPRDKLFVLLL